MTTISDIQGTLQVITDRLSKLAEFKIPIEYHDYDVHDIVSKTVDKRYFDII